LATPSLKCEIRANGEPVLLIALDIFIDGCASRTGSALAVPGRTHTKRAEIERVV
jgi:hypothetical protein